MGGVAFADFDFGEFWDDSEYALREYVEAPPSDDLIASVEAELGGYRLPAAYIELARVHNGGTPRRRAFPTNRPTSWADDHIEITGIAAIGRSKTYSLCGDLGSNFMIEEWGYPRIGVCVADTPSAGHEMVMLDYRTCGRTGQPRVVYVDQEAGFDIAVLAPDFESFIRGLVSAGASG